MANETDNLVLEQLRHIRRAVDGLALDMIDVKARISSIEGTLGHLMTQVGVLHGRVDRIEEPLAKGWSAASNWPTRNHLDPDHQGTDRDHLGRRSGVTGQEYEDQHGEGEHSNHQGQG